MYVRALEREREREREKEREREREREREIHAIEVTLETQFSVGYFVEHLFHLLNFLSNLIITF
jgi:hypothetical protein